MQVQASYWSGKEHSGGDLCPHRPVCRPCVTASDLYTRVCTQSLTADTLFSHDSVVQILPNPPCPPHWSGRSPRGPSSVQQSQHSPSGAHSTALSLGMETPILTEAVGGPLTGDWSGREDLSSSGRLAMTVLLLPLSVATSSIERPSPMICQLFIASFKEKTQSDLTA